MITEQEMELLKQMFVSRNECDNRATLNNEKFTRLEVGIAKIATKLTIITAILGCIGSAILAVAVKMLFGGI